MSKQPTKKELFDQRTMLYFYPNKSGGTPRVRDYDRAKMAALSSRGLQPNNRTPGFLRLLWGKTYRDLQITQWKEDVMAGLITKYEIYQSVPEWLRPWTESKLKDVPYDQPYTDKHYELKNDQYVERQNPLETLTVTDMLIKEYHNV